MRTDSPVAEHMLARSASHLGSSYQSCTRAARGRRLASDAAPQEEHRPPRDLVMRLLLSRWQVTETHVGGKIALVRGWPGPCGWAYD